ncbi:MAG: periplasmic heavy metal sensor [Bacteroidota bacterium]
MSYFSNKKFSFWIVVAVIILNFTAIGTIMYKLYLHPHPHQMEKKEMPCAQSYLENELQLTPAQAAEFKKLKEKHHESVYLVFEAMKQKKNYISENMTKPNADTNMLFKTTEDIGALYAQSRKLFILHYFELSKVCNATQKVKLAEIFSNMFCCEGSMNEMTAPSRHRHESRGGCNMNKTKY